MKNQQVEDRYNRQELIEGWNQEMLSRARVAIVGSGPLAVYTAIALTALGIGRLELYDNSQLNGRRGLLFKSKEGEPQIKGLEAILREMNPSSHIKGINLSLETAPLIYMLGGPNLIIDATNSPLSKNAVLKFGTREAIPVVTASSDELRGEMQTINLGGVYSEGLLERYGKKSQGDTISGILGGIIAEESRKLIMPLDCDGSPVKRLGYSLNHEERFTLAEGWPLQSGTDIQFVPKDKKALIIGAGALGNFAALGMLSQGIGRIDIIDFDEVESTNLNRQILFYGFVGKKKATALANRLGEIFPSADIRGIVEKFSENSHYFGDNRPDIILDCVDSFAVRAIINYFAVRYKIPLVSGGTNPRSGQVVVYEPGKSACLDCKLGVEKALAEDRATDSCMYAPDPSVIMTNQIVGNMMVGEAIKVLNRDDGEPVKRILKYDSDAPGRGGLVGPGDACSCKKPGIKRWLSGVDAKAHYQKH